MTRKGMMNRQEMYRRTTQVFIEIVALPVQDRELALQLACAGEPRLRKEVQELLRYHRDHAADRAAIEAN